MSHSTATHVKQPAKSTADLDLEHRVREFLTTHRRVPLNYVQVDAHNGTVTLRGAVDSFYERQLCIQCCRHVAGVNHLEDHIEVVSRNERLRAS